METLFVVVLNSTEPNIALFDRKEPQANSRAQEAERETARRQENTCSWLVGHGNHNHLWITSPSLRDSSL